jgi:two-component sensor histidine kinase
MKLMTILNDLDSVSNIAELKNEYEKNKYILDKVREEKEMFQNELRQISLTHNELQHNYSKLINENNSQKEQYQEDTE